MWLLVIGYGHLLLAMHINHGLWLLAINICTKKCACGYNPFWLLAIVNCLRLLGIGYGLLVIRYFRL
jgi:hypothetical protein